MAGLKRCPLCGGEPKMEQVSTQSVIRCKCGYGICWTGDNAEEKAIKDWNTHLRLEDPIMEKIRRRDGKILKAELIKSYVAFEGDRRFIFKAEDGKEYRCVQGLKGIYEELVV